jgi:hypothetical protein
LAVVLNLQREPRNLEYAVEDPILADDYKIAATIATDAANLKGSVWGQEPRNNLRRVGPQGRIVSSSAK